MRELQRCRRGLDASLDLAFGPAEQGKRPSLGRQRQEGIDEIVAFLRLLVPAGAQTTYRMLTNLLYALLTHPDQFDALRRDPSLIPRAVEEGLRWEPPLLYFGRVATTDTEIEGHHVPAGKTVKAGQKVR